MSDPHPSDAHHQEQLESLVDVYLEACPPTRAAFVKWLSEHADNPAIEAYDHAHGEMRDRLEALRPTYRGDEDEP
jgi:hypothetical protein